MDLGSFQTSLLSICIVYFVARCSACGENELSSFEKKLFSTIENLGRLPLDRKYQWKGESKSWINAFSIFLHALTIHEHSRKEKYLHSLPSAIHVANKLKRAKFVARANRVPFLERQKFTARTLSYRRCS